MKEILLASMEVSTLFFMTALFVASLLKKEKHKHQKILSCLISMVIISLGIDISYNIFVVTNFNLAYAQNLLLSEYVLFYAVIIGSHYFFLSDIANFKKPSVFNFFLPIIYMALNLGFIFFSGEKNLFFVIQQVTPTTAQIISLTIKISILIYDFFLTIYYRNRLTPASFWSQICYEIVPVIFAYVDLYLNTSYIYLAIALLLFIDYISLTYAQDIMIIQQKRHLAEQEKEIAQKQNKITVSQIGPHFLYNSISSIMALCKKDSEKAVKGLADFSDYLRENMRFITIDVPIPFERELTHIETYVRLEKLRFGDNLNMVYDIDVKDFSIPALSVQPLIENAIKHGIGQRESGGTVRLITRKIENGILIQVADNGVGTYRKASYNEKSQKEHIGIDNVTERISTMCGGTLEIDSTDNVGTTATIILPTKKGNLE